IPNRGLSESGHADYAAVLATTGYFAGAAAETAGLAANLAAFGDIGGRLGDLPVTVVSRGRPEVPAGLGAAEAVAFEATWASLQRDLLRVSAGARQAIAAGSGHDIHLDEPEVVIESVRTLVASAAE